MAEDPAIVRLGVRFAREVRIAQLSGFFLGSTPGVPGAFVMSDFRGASPLAEGVVQGQGQLVLLMPEEWTGKRFPLLDQIDVGDRLAKGTWLVVLYHLGCGECQELIEQYKQCANDNDGRVRGAGRRGASIR